MHRIFIVHGHDRGMLRDVDAFVRRIGIDPVVLMDERNRAEQLLKSLSKMRTCLLQWFCSHRTIWVEQWRTRPGRKGGALGKTWYWSLDFSFGP